jgi:hypothetical protein
MMMIISLDGGHLQSIQNFEVRIQSFPCFALLCFASFFVINERFKGNGRLGILMIYVFLKIRLFILYTIISFFNLNLIVAPKMPRTFFYRLFVFSGQHTLHISQTVSTRSCKNQIIIGCYF